jgi:hypothetical protein
MGEGLWDRSRLSRRFFSRPPTLSLPLFWLLLLLF